MVANMKHSVIPFTAIISMYKQCHLNCVGPEKVIKSDSFLIYCENISVSDCLKWWEQLFLGGGGGWGEKDGGEPQHLCILSSPPAPLLSYVNLLSYVYCSAY